MVRTQVQFTEEQYRAIKELSRQSGEPIAAIVRRAVDRLLLTRKPDRSALYRIASEVAGKYEAGGADISVKHDDYLDEEFGT